MTPLESILFLTSSTIIVFLVWWTIHAIINVTKGDN